jgi:GNAT superfamily N-acetyltransferase
MTVNADSAEFGVEVERHGTELVVRLNDTGEPISGVASEVLGLVDLGLLTAAVGGPDHSHGAVVGNRSEIRVPLAAHHAILDSGNLELIDPEAPRSDEAVELRSLEAGDAAALTRCIYRCYGWTYPGADLYYPERIAASIAAGRRVGEVAVTAEGEVASHWGAVVVADGVVETGVTVTDPRFRGRGLANQLGERLLERLVASGVHGRMREPVLTHPATQHIALREGAAMVGVHLHAAAPLQQVGITDGMLAERVSVTVMYGPLLPLEPAEMWVPSQYRPIASAILEGADWPRTLGEIRTIDPPPANTVISSSYDALNSAGSVTISVVGADLIDAVDEVLGQLRRAGAEMITVHLPASQPALAVTASSVLASVIASGPSQNHTMCAMGM